MPAAWYVLAVERKGRTREPFHRVLYRSCLIRSPVEELSDVRHQDSTLDTVLIRLKDILDAPNPVKASLQALDVKSSYTSVPIAQVTKDCADKIMAEAAWLS